MNCYGIQVDGGSGYYDYKNCAVTISGTASVSSQENVASVIVTPEGDQNKISISGGYFSYDPSEYLATGMATLPSDKSGYAFMVGVAPQTEVEPATGDPSVNMNGIDPNDQEIVEDAASSGEEDILMMDVEGDLLESYYPGLADVATEQLIAKAPMMSAVVNEIVLAQCATEEAAAAAASILQDRVDAQAEGGAWYPESMETWSDAQVVQHGTYVAMIATAEHQDEITEQFNAQFA